MTQPIVLQELCITPLDDVGLSEEHFKTTPLKYLGSTDDVLGYGMFRVEGRRQPRHHFFYV